MEEAEGRRRKAGRATDAKQSEKDVGKSFKK